MSDLRTGEVRPRLWLETPLRPGMRWPLATCRFQIASSSISSGGGGGWLVGPETRGMPASLSPSIKPCQSSCGSMSAVDGFAGIPGRGVPGAICCSGVIFCVGLRGLSGTYPSSSSSSSSTSGSVFLAKNHMIMRIVTATPAKITVRDGIEPNSGGADASGSFPMMLRGTKLGRSPIGASL